ncbi:MAG: type II toxin-antitoxin system PemK/MazF family toxin [Phycisphaerae bacterium]
MPEGKRRPVLILTRESALTHLANVTVAPVTTRMRGIDTEVELDPVKDGVALRSALSCDNLATSRSLSFTVVSSGSTTTR